MDVEGPARPPPGQPPTPGGIHFDPSPVRIVPPGSFASPGLGGVSPGFAGVTAPGSACVIAARRIKSTMFKSAAMMLSPLAISIRHEHVEHAPATESALM